ncbi:expressed unknown protein [Seminavis robusta]|uniref:Uncharacterized protein n=1 Tax=Seminavis robusta TaxID=568900 RepID=A0A9N8HAT5_9STRA|nr:expressed unknown protein [Seminavis robusta]|eukprot:Sro237_g095311.1  (101) ;mRNA; f:50010-50312
MKCCRPSCHFWCNMARKGTPRAQITVPVPNGQGLLLATDKAPRETHTLILPEFGSQAPLLSVETNAKVPKNINSCKKRQVSRSTSSGLGNPFYRFRRKTW